MLDAGLITAIFGAGGALAVVGGGIKFVWGKIEDRFKAIELSLEECRLREISSQERRAVLTTVIELLWQEVKRLAPDADILERARKLMDHYKAIGISGHS